MESIKDAAKSVTGSGSGDKPGEFESGTLTSVIAIASTGLN